VQDAYTLRDVTDIAMYSSEKNAHESIQIEVYRLKSFYTVATLSV